VRCRRTKQHPHSRLWCKRQGREGPNEERTKWPVQASLSTISHGRARPYPATPRYMVNGPVPGKGVPLSSRLQRLYSFWSLFLHKRVRWVLITRLTVILCHIKWGRFRVFDSASRHDPYSDNSGNQNTNPIASLPPFGQRCGLFACWQVNRVPVTTRRTLLIIA
jgi:hypothetical protein